MTYFSKKETSCKCGCGMNISDDLREMLDIARAYSKIPYVVTSGARCKEHNEREEGSPTSSHLKGLAVDLRADDSRERFLILAGLIEAGFTRIGISEEFIHVDIDEDKSGEVTWLY